MQMELQNLMWQEMELQQLQELVERRGEKRIQVTGLLQASVTAHVRDVLEESGGVRGAAVLGSAEKFHGIIRSVTRELIRRYGVELNGMIETNKTIDDFAERVGQIMAQVVQTLVDSCLASGKKKYHAMNEKDEGMRILIDVFEMLNALPDDAAVARVRKAEVRPLRKEDVPAIKEAYGEHLLTNEQAFLLWKGLLPEFQKSIKLKKGPFLKPFEAYEEGEILKLLERTAELEKRHGKRDQYEKEIIRGFTLWLEDELLSTHIYTEPPEGPVVDPEYKAQTEELIETGTSKGHMHWEPQREKEKEGQEQSTQGPAVAKNFTDKDSLYAAMMRGAVAMLFLFVSREKAATNRGEKITIGSLSRGIESVRSYYLHRMTYALNGKVVDNHLPIGGNLGSGWALFDFGHTPLVMESANVKNSPSRIIQFERNFLSLWPNWQHVLAQMETLKQRARAKWPEE